MDKFVSDHFKIADIGVSWVDKLNKRFSNKIQKYNFITPNLLTSISFIFALGAALLFLIAGFKYLIYAGILILISYFFDYTDGEIARLKKMQTDFGFWYDRITDQIKLSFLILALGIRAYYIENASVHILIVTSIAILAQLVKEISYTLFEICCLANKLELDNLQSEYNKLILSNINIKFSTKNISGKIFFHTVKLLAFMQYEQFITLSIFPILVKAEITIYIYAAMSLIAFIGRSIIYINIYYKKDKGKLKSEK